MGRARDLGKDLDHPEEELASRGLNPTSVYWAIALFFGCTIAFAAVHRLTQHSPTAVTALAQVATLGLIVGALVLYMRRRDDDG